MPHEVRRSLVLFFCLLVFASAVGAQGDAVDAYIRAEMDKRRIPGVALVVIQRGTVVKIQGYGVATLEHDAPVTPDTVFELASVTKQFTAAGIMLLVEEGKLGLDDAISRHERSRPWNANGQQTVGVASSQSTARGR